MIKQEMIERIRHYLEKMPDIDPKIVLDGLSLLHLHHEVELQTEILSTRLGFNGRQMETLEALFHHPERTLTPAQLADEVHLTRSAMTSNLDSLERQGYLSRSLHKADRRMVAVTLTEKGVGFCEERLPVRYHDMAMIIGLLTPEDRLIVFKAYNRIREFLKELLEEEQIDFTKPSPARA
jgi:DNA-binding MarR family transcriptional regulator